MSETAATQPVGEQPAGYDPAAVERRWQARWEAEATNVADLSDAHVRALHALDGASRTYNLGNGRGFSVREVIETCREVTGHPIPAIVGPRRPGDPAVLVAGSDRIRRELPCLHHMRLLPR